MRIMAEKKGEVYCEKTDQTRKKVRGSATVRRMSWFLFVLGGAGIGLFAATAGCLAFGERGAKIAAAALGAAGCLAAVLFAVYAILRRKILKNADKFAFAATKTSSFECFGIFLAMNVTFLDGEGNLREGRSRFMFGTRDAEAWQNLPLEIGYRADKPDEARVIVLGAAPVSALSDLSPETPENPQNQ